MTCRADACNQGRKPCPCPEVCSAPDFICEWEYLIAVIDSFWDAAKSRIGLIVIFSACAFLLGLVLAR